ncbi:MAG: cytoplasmic protein [Sulfobacillus acidophilus]|uniref:Cytoplasmic protein n=1 Tax=Sulfobacillus acidophilus TaxID=53633 RepID=A0A2T2WK47_9FIRM|nr:MAG: cytoplasmic protein [Sulfobacillus acidophilus]
MRATLKVLLAGESWESISTHIKGFDQFSSTVYHSGADPLIQALTPIAEVTYLPNHRAAREFPLSITDLSAYDAVILSDIGANTLLLHPDTWERGELKPNRLRLLAEYVSGGGGLIMAGGYLSFQGFQAAAGYAGTPLEAVLPVTLSRYDDRIEEPEGLSITLLDPNHPILQGLPGPWPYLLGVNQVTPKANATVLAKAGESPLLVVGTCGHGRSVAWTSDVGPHWCPDVFCQWSGYAPLWQQIVTWAAAKSA